MPEHIVSSTVRDFLMNTRLSGRFWKKTSRTGKSGSGTVTG